MSNTKRVIQGSCNTIQSSQNNPPVKMYIDGLKPDKINKYILRKLDDYFREKKETFHLYSEDGIYSIENSKIYKKTPTDETIKIIKNGDFTYYFDKSSFKKTSVLSQLPVHAIPIKRTQFTFCESTNINKTKVMLVIDGIYTTPQEIGENVKNGTIGNNYDNFIVDEIYFVLKEEIDNYLIKKELNVFLSLLI